jgi:hypothetical protein
LRAQLQQLSVGEGDRELKGIERSGRNGSIRSPGTRGKLSKPRSTVEHAFCRKAADACRMVSGRLMAFP